MHPPRSGGGMILQSAALIKRSLPPSSSTLSHAQPARPIPFHRKTPSNMPVISVSALTLALSLLRHHLRERDYKVTSVYLQAACPSNTDGAPAQM